MKLCLQCHHVFERENWQCPACDYTPPIKEGVIQFAPELDDSRDGFDPLAFKSLYEVEERNFWFQSRNKLISWAIKKYFFGIRNFLEIGCGTGFVLSNIAAQFSGLKCSGSEIYSEGLALAKTRLSDIPLWQMDARNIPFQSEFDLLGAFDVLEHIDEDEATLDQMFQAVRSGGGIILTVPQHPWLWSHADERACHKRRYTRTELKKKVKNAGFEVIRTTSFVSILLPLMAYSRLKEKALKANSNAELSLGSSLNSVLEAVMNLEAAMIRSGVSFPAGGSLLLVAKKPVIAS